MINRVDWDADVPAVKREMATRWELTLGTPFHPGGQCSLVVPAMTADGTEAVLKLGWRHAEALHEADGLREWNGDGAVRLLASAELDGTTALLLEQCSPGTPLSAVMAEPEQDVIVANLLRRLGKQPPAGHPFRPLAAMCDLWADSFDRRLAARPDAIDAGLAREGISLFRALPRNAAENVLLCTDLHAENILAAQREPWLLIDPKPYVGDPAYDVIQHLLNCEDRLLTDPAGLAKRIADLAGLDAERVTLWLFARCACRNPLAGHYSARWPAGSRPEFHRAIPHMRLRGKVISALCGTSLAAMPVVVGHAGAQPSTPDIPQAEVDGVAVHYGISAGEARNPLRQQEAAHRVAAALPASLRDKTAGQWFDPAGGALVVAVTSAAAADEVRAAGARPALVSHGQAELDRLNARVRALVGNDVPGVYGWGIDVRADTVSVSIDRSRKTAATNEFLHRLGDGVTVTETDSSPQQQSGTIQTGSPYVGLYPLFAELARTLRDGGPLRLRHQLLQRPSRRARPAGSRDQRALPLSHPPTW